MPSAAVDIEPDILETQARLRAGDLLAERGVYGIVWLDRDLVVRRRFGILTAFVAEGACVTQSVAPLVGLESDIQQLTDDGAVRVPNVKIFAGANPEPRLDIVVYRLPCGEGFLMTLAQVGSDTGVEMELARQVRARLMAETEVLMKSRELARTNAELRMANNDLEQFAAIVTHDLKAPMRALNYLVDDIEKAAAGEDASTVHSKLADLRRQTSRMSSMLSALLDYASTGPAHAALEHVDTLSLVREIVGSLPSGSIVVEIRGEWPAIETLATPFDLALRNLIDNAIKHHDSEQGHILVECRDSGDALDIYIKDDGPGIDSEHRTSVFLPFRTLDGRGSGMGLAIAKKMVEAVGGAIALGPDLPGVRGASFNIHWPKQVVT